MQDQAHELRSLKLETALAGGDSKTARPWTVVVTGGKGGVGISTLSVNLAATLSRLGRKVLLASASERPDDLAMICGLPELHATADETRPLQGPNGLMIVKQTLRPSATAATRMCNALAAVHRLASCADVAIIDAGSRFFPDDSGLTTTVDTLLYVTTSDNVAVMDTYAAIKEHVRCSAEADVGCGAVTDHQPQLALVVNRCGTTATARCAYDRIDETCKRFLQKTIRYVGDVPDDSSLCTAQTGSLPAVLQSPTSPAAKAIDRVAANVVPARGASECVPLTDSG